MSLTGPLTGKVALVTGASAGIGLAVTERLIAEGATVIMVARTEATLNAEAARLGSRAVPWPLDIGYLEFVQSLPAAVIARFGRLDIVINNAGLHHRGPAMKHAPERHAAMVNVNLSAPIMLSLAALPHLPDGGAIVQVSSVSGYVPVPGMATYGATKAGLRFFTRSLAQEHPRLHISTVSPGPVDTGFFGDARDVEPVVFSQPMCTADEVAAEVMACVRGPSQELALPRSSGRLATVAYLWPALATWLRPRLTARGERNKAAYIKRKGL